MYFALYYERLRHNMQEPVRYFATISPRKMIFGSNLLVAVLSLGLSGFSIFLCTLLYDPGFISGWVDWLGLSIVGLCLASVCIIGMRGAHLVSLELLLTYFWGIIIFIAPLLLGTIAAFDFYSYMRTWFSHQWDQPNFQRLRNLFCPVGQDKLKCMAPYHGGADFPSITAWCMDKFNATDCQTIRDDAMSEAIWWGKSLTVTQASVCILDLVMIVWSIYVCYGMITAPVITQSMNDIINYLLLIPIGGCVGIAAYLWWLTKYELLYSWIARLFAAIAVAQVVALPLGITAGRSKSRPLLTMYIAFMTIITAALAVAGCIGLILAEAIPDVFQPTSDQAADIACSKGLTGCCCCNQPDLAGNRCPEWGTLEIVQLVVTDIKISGAVAFISMIYLIGALVVASYIYHNLKNYQSEYV